MTAQAVMVSNVVLGDVKGFMGPYQLTGVVDRLGILGSYRVSLFDHQTGTCVASLWSDPSGQFTFNNLAYKDKGYFATASDHLTPTQKSVIFDYITPIFDVANKG